MSPEMTDESPTRMSFGFFALNANSTQPERRFWQKLNARAVFQTRVLLFQTTRNWGNIERGGEERKAGKNAFAVPSYTRVYTKFVKKFPFNYYKRRRRGSCRLSDPVVALDIE